MSSDRTPRVSDEGAAGGAQPLLAFADALLAKSQAEAARGAAEVRQYVTFWLRDEEYGIPILQCREIVRVSAITRLPEAPAHVRGVVNLRGRIVPVVDTRKRLRLEPAMPTAKSRLIVVEVAGRQLALLVDQVARILKLAVTDVEPLSPGMGPSPGAIGLGRVGDAKVCLFDAERLLCDEPAVEATTKGQPE